LAPYKLGERKGEGERVCVCICVYVHVCDKIQGAAPHEPGTENKEGFDRS